MGYRMSGKLNVREITKDDIHLLANYWDTRDNAMLHAMGADPAKMPTKSQLIESLSNQIKTPISLKKAFALIWRLDDTSIGHNNVNKISFGDHAYMHFHIWNRVNRK